MAKASDRAAELEEMIMQKLKATGDDKIRLDSRDARDILFMLDWIKITMKRLEEIAE